MHLAKVCFAVCLCAGHTRCCHVSACWHEEEETQAGLQLNTAHIHMHLTYFSKKEQTAWLLLIIYSTWAFICVYHFPRLCEELAMKWFGVPRLVQVAG